MLETIQEKVDGIMARKTASRLELRKQAEAAEKQGKSAPKKKTRKKAAAKKKTTKRKTVKAPERKRLVWGVFNGSMKEEARFSYDQRKAAEQKIEQLRAKVTKTKRLYFIQPIKEVIVDAPPADEAEEKK